MLMASPYYENAEHNENEDLQNLKLRRYEKVDVVNTQEVGTTHTE